MAGWKPATVAVTQGPARQACAGPGVPGPYDASIPRPFAPRIWRSLQFAERTQFGARRAVSPPRLAYGGTNPIWRRGLRFSILDSLLAERTQLKVAELTRPQTSEFRISSSKPWFGTSSIRHERRRGRLRVCATLERCEGRYDRLKPAMPYFCSAASTLARARCSVSRTSTGSVSAV